MDRGLKRRPDLPKRPRAPKRSLAAPPRPVCPVDPSFLLSPRDAISSSPAPEPLKSQPREAAEPREAGWHPSRCLRHPLPSAPAPSCAPAAADPGPRAPGGPLNPLLLGLGMQEAEPQLAFLMRGRFAAGGSLTITFGLANQADPVYKVRRG